MATVALLSNPTSTGNRAFLPRIREYCARHSDIFHYEVEAVEQIDDALASIARVRPRVLIINGGDGTVQAALTALHRGRQLGDNPPPIAVLPNGKTNLIAQDLGWRGDPVEALDRIVAMADGGVEPHVVRRELIALSEDGAPPVLGMFMGGAGLADAMLYCRNHLYPLGLPNGLSHVLATLASFFTVLTGMTARFLPQVPESIRVSLGGGRHEGRFSVLIVTTLEQMLVGTRADTSARGLKLMAVDRSALAVLRALFAGVTGRAGKQHFTGVHIDHGDRISIESDASDVILDGEIFHAARGRPITLSSTAPMPFLRLAA
ncbi:DAGKc domain-containing protein [Sphingomonas antarctica]|uniref:diacylglycerol/lipid kinase family protein n=1 Tax=Sphingomonas antarctica TaxID=2040274 RepID=UPI0039ED5A9F